MQAKGGFYGKLCACSKRRRVKKFCSTDFVDLVQQLIRRHYYFGGILGLDETITKQLLNQINEIYEKKLLPFFFVIST